MRFADPGALPLETAVRALTVVALVGVGTLGLGAGLVAVAVPLVAFELLALGWRGLYRRERVAAVAGTLLAVAWFRVEYGLVSSTGLALLVPALAVDVGYRRLEHRATTPGPRETTPASNAVATDGAADAPGEPTGGADRVAESAGGADGVAGSAGGTDAAGPSAEPAGAADAPGDASTGTAGTADAAAGPSAESGGATDAVDDPDEAVEVPEGPPSEPAELAAGADAGGGAGPFPVAVAVRDAVDGGPLDDPVTVRARQPDAERAATGTGTVELDLPAGTWDLTATLGPHEATRSVTVDGPESVTLELGPTELVVDVVRGGDPVAAQSVRCATDDGERYEASTDGEGRATVALPAGTRSVAVATDDDEPGADLVLPASDRVRFVIDAVHGQVTLRVTVDGDPVGGVPVAMTPALEADAAVAGLVVRSTDDGSHTVAVPVGTYDLRLADDAHAALSAAPGSVTVEEGRSTVADVAATFAFDLDADQRDRLAALRERGRPDAPPGAFNLATYYHRAVVATVDPVEDLAAVGSRVVAHDRDPDVLVDELLAAGERWGDRVATTVAAHDVPPVTLPGDDPSEWSGPEFASLFDHLAATPDERAGRVASRVSDLDERLAFGPVPDVAAVRDIVETLAEGADDDPPAQYVAVALLAATDHLLDHRSLVERLAGEDDA